MNFKKTKIKPVFMVKTKKTYVLPVKQCTPKKCNCKILFYPIDVFYLRSSNNQINSYIHLN